MVHIVYLLHSQYRGWPYEGSKALYQPDDDFFNCSKIAGKAKKTITVSEQTNMKEDPQFENINV